jgi:myo-inositol-1(or 4)-monophosphatase
LIDVDMNWLKRLAREAGELALSHFGRVQPSLKADRSLVTQADLAVEAFVRERLEEARPGETVLGEEDGTGARASTGPGAADVIWAVDPVDGTRAFAHGFPIWGVSIGALVDGVPAAGVFVLPVTGEVYATDGRTAWRNGTALSPPDPPVDDNAVLLVSEGAFSRLYPAYPGKVLSLGSAAAHLCYAAAGSAVGAIDRASIWDYAAGAAILRVLGIPLRHVSGAPVDLLAMRDGRPAAEPTLACPLRHFDVLQRAYLGG